MAAKRHTEGRVLDFVRRGSVPEHEPLTLYDFLKIAMFDGDDTGMVTMPVKDILIEVVDLMNEWDRL